MSWADSTRLKSMARPAVRETTPKATLVACVRQTVMAKIHRWGSGPGMIT